MKSGSRSGFQSRPHRAMACTRCVAPNRSIIFTLPVRAVLRGLRLLQVAVQRIFV
jgi:hypothetical protein